MFVVRNGRVDVIMWRSHLEVATQLLSLCILFAGSRSAGEKRCLLLGMVVWMSSCGAVIWK